MKITQKTKEVVSKTNISYKEILLSPEDIEKILIEHLQREGVEVDDFQVIFKASSSYKTNDWGMFPFLVTGFEGQSSNCTKRAKNDIINTILTKP